MKGVITFSHFSYVNKTPSMSHLLRFMARGTAVLCKEFQKGIDLIIPVLMPSDNHEFIMSLEKMTFILVQVKNYKDPISDSLDITIADRMKIGEIPGLEFPECDYLTINMNVGEPKPIYKSIDCSFHQKAIVLGGIDDSLFPCLGFESFSNSFMPSDRKQIDKLIEQESSRREDILPAEQLPTTGKVFTAEQLPTAEEVSTTEELPSHENVPTDDDMAIDEEMTTEDSSSKQSRRKQRIKSRVIPCVDGKQPSTMSKLLRLLLGKKSQPADPFNPSTREYENTLSIFTGFYPDQMKSLDTMETEHVRRSKRLKVD
jgi:hypothetical protein